MNKEEILDNYHIKYKKHIFSKSIKITLKSEKNVLVTMPVFCPYRTAKEFLYKNFEKIKSIKIKSSALSDEELKDLKKRARAYLPKRIEELSQIHGFCYNKLALRNQKTRFGSCSYKNNINLNINLMNYDNDVIDYVIIHELCHTKIKNHSRAFWEEVSKHCPNYRELRKRLKK